MEKRKILVVDDEPALTRMVKQHLECTGRYVVYEANRGQDALRAAREYQPDLILLDVVMPDLSDGTVASQICADPELCRIPIVLLTPSVADPHRGGDGLGSSGLLFLPKPVTPHSLLRCVTNNLG